jgi:hypothetical protein
MRSRDVVPVLISIVIIILVAVLEKQSKLFAAIAATMPVGIPLALWIVYAANGGDPAIVRRFSLDMLLSILPTVAFLVAIWLAARAGLRLIPILLIGYAVWGLGTVLLVWGQRLWGR